VADGELGLAPAVLLVKLSHGTAEFVGDRGGVVVHVGCVGLAHPPVAKLTPLGRD
jgi:hypothetical protein